LAANHQRATCRYPQRPWAANASAIEKQRKRSLLRRCFPLFFDKMTHRTSGNDGRPSPCEPEDQTALLNDYISKIAFYQSIN
jgi:hypothetical protein